MPDISQASNQSSIQPSDQGGVQVAQNVEDCTPLELNPAFISLRLPSNVFKQGVGGDAA
jgi:hypothetical protein